MFFKLMLFGIVSLFFTACDQRPASADQNTARAYKQDNLAAPSKEANANPAAVTADAVYMNGKIITVNDEQPKAQKVAIKDGKIIYVGDVRGAKPLTGKATKQIDLNNHTMVPGFVDAHGHVVNAGLQAASANLLPLPDGPVNDFAQLIDTLKAWSTTNIGKKPKLGFKSSSVISW